jgi:hypothetical protein
MIRIRFTDTSTNQPTALTALTTTPTVLVNGSAATIGAPVWGAGRLDLFIPVTATIAEGATVTVSAPSNWATTVAGTASALTAAPATNRGVFLPTPPARVGTLALGQNLEGQYYGAPTIQVYSNLLKGSTWGNVGEAGIITLDSRGYPTLFNGLNYLCNIADSGTDYGGAGKGANAVPSGHFTFVYPSGVAGLVPRNGDNDTIITQIGSPVSSGGVTRAVWDYRPTLRFAPVIQCFFQGFDVGDGSDNHTADVNGEIGIYPPDPADPTGNTAWANPSKYWPGFKAQFGSMKGWRNMDVVATNQTNTMTAADLGTLADAGYIMNRRHSVPVARVAPYTGTDPFFMADGNTLVEVTTGVDLDHLEPHNFVTGNVIGFGTGVGTILSPGSQSGGVNESVLGSVGSRSIRVLSPTTFIAKLDANITPSVATNTLIPTPGPTAVCFRDVPSRGLPSEDHGNVTAYLGADWLWRCCPPLAEDALVALLAQQDAETMPPGKKIVFEYGNELWNSFIAAANVYVRGMSRLLFGFTTDGFYHYAPFQVYRAIQTYRIYRDAWVAAGRDADDIEHFLGSWGGGGSTTVLLGYLTGNNNIDGINVNLSTGVSTRIADNTVVATFPGLGTIDGDVHLTGSAFYYGNDQYTDLGIDALDDALDALDVEQCLDLFESWIALNPVGRNYMDHQAAIDASGLVNKPRLAGYEGGPDYVVPRTKTRSSPAWFAKACAVHRHPRMFKIARTVPSQMEAAGVVKANGYYLNGGNSDAHWDTYFGYSMVAGTGDPSENADPTDLRTAKSQAGGALNDFMGLVTNAPDIGVGAGALGHVTGAGAGDIETIIYARLRGRPRRIIVS